MKKTVFLSAVIFFTFSSLFSQQTTVSYSGSLDHINVVVLNLTCNTSLQASSGNSLKMKSLLITKGEVRGWQFPSKRPEFQIVAKISNDSLIISTPQRFVPKTIGIATYSETVLNTIRLPADKHIITTGNGQLTIEDNFNDLIISNSGTIFISRKTAPGE